MAKREDSKKVVKPVFHFKKILPTIIIVFLVLTLIINSASSSKEKNALTKELGELTSSLKISEKEYSELNTKFLSLENKGTDTIKTISSKAETAATKAAEDKTKAAETYETLRLKYNDLVGDFNDQKAKLIDALGDFVQCLDEKKVLRDDLFACRFP